MSVNKRSLYKKITRLSVPIVLSQLLDSCVYCADILMTNYVGQEALSASSLAGEFCNIALMFFCGISAGSVMLGSQYWGKKEVLHGKVWNETLPDHSDPAVCYAMKRLFIPTNWKKHIKTGKADLKQQKRVSFRLLSVWLTWPIFHLIP